MPSKKRRILVTGVTFSLMAGIFHAYYTIALAPVDLNALVKRACSDGRVTETSAR